jgi:hypothetical protein
MILRGRMLPLTLLLLVKALLIGGVVVGFCWAVYPLLLMKSNAMHTFVFLLWCCGGVPVVYLIWRIDYV